MTNETTIDYAELRNEAGDDAHNEVCRLAALDATSPRSTLDGRLEAALGQPLTVNECGQCSSLYAKGWTLAAVASTLFGRTVRDAL